MSCFDGDLSCCGWCLHEITSLSCGLARVHSFRLLKVTLTHDVKTHMHCICPCCVVLCCVLSAVATCVCVCVCVLWFRTHRPTRVSATDRPQPFLFLAFPCLVSFHSLFLVVVVVVELFVLVVVATCPADANAKTKRGKS